MEKVFCKNCKHCFSNEHGASCEHWSNWSDNYYDKNSSMVEYPSTKNKNNNCKYFERAKFLGWF